MSVATKSARLEEVLSKVQLPALPQSAVHLLDLSRNPENGPAEYAVPIEADPGLASQVLRFVNSSFFGFRSEVTSIRLAINLVGIRTIKNFALWSAVFSLIPNSKQISFNIRSLWQDSLRRGIFARELGVTMGIADADDLFTASLLQDVAIPILLKELGDEYCDVWERRTRDGRRLSEIEREVFGWTHADAGAMILKNWKMPENFARMISQHTAFDERWLHSKAMASQVAVSLSCLLPSAHDNHWNDAEVFRKAMANLSKSYKLDVMQMFAKTDRDLENFAPVLKLNSPSKSLVAALQQSKC